MLGCTDLPLALVNDLCKSGPPSRPQRPLFLTCRKCRKRFDPANERALTRHKCTSQLIKVNLMPPVNLDEIKLTALEVACCAAEAGLEASTVAAAVSAAAGRTRQMKLARVHRLQVSKAKREGLLNPIRILDRPPEAQTTQPPHYFDSAQEAAETWETIRDNVRQKSNNPEYGMHSDLHKHAGGNLSALRQMVDKQRTIEKPQPNQQKGDSAPLARRVSIILGQQSAPQNRRPSIATVKRVSVTNVSSPAQNWEGQKVVSPARRVSVVSPSSHGRASVVSPARRVSVVSAQSTPKSSRASVVGSPLTPQTSRLPTASVRRVSVAGASAGRISVLDVVAKASPLPPSRPPFHELQKLSANEQDDVEFI